MALTVAGYASSSDDAYALDRWTEAHSLLAAAFSHAFRVGNLPDAAAAALMLGVVSALRGDGEAVSWFAQAVAAAAQGAQMETLWRAHINFATALYQSGERVDESVRDHARAALDLMEDTLPADLYGDQSPRFAVIALPMGQAVRFLVEAGDSAGTAALERHAALRRLFADPLKGTLRDDRGGHLSNEWITVGGEGYMIY
jgi:hypothetical protein